MNTIAVKKTELGHVTAAVAEFLDAPHDEIELLGDPREVCGGLVIITVGTRGRIGFEVEDDKRLAAGLSKLIDSPVYVEAGEEEDFLAEYIDGECVRLVRYSDEVDEDMFIDL